MAHEIANINGKASMAFVGDRREIWHGLGQELTDNASIEVWKQQAGMNWEIQSSPITFQTPEGINTYTGQRVLYRGDNNQQLSIVSDDYKVVQPGQVLEFFRDLVEEQGMKLSTAGVLFEGRRFWALADTGRAADILGNDRIKGMLLLTTSCDGTMATNALFTSVRVVCNNTLRIALKSNQDAAGRIRVSHKVEFDPKNIKDKLGLVDKAWNDFLSNITDLSKARIDDKSAQKFVYDLFAKKDIPVEEQPYTVAKNVNAILSRYTNGMGTNMVGGTLWGLVNSVTEHIDHDTAHMRKADAKLWDTWYGKGSDIKTNALNKALEMV